MPTKRKKAGLSTRMRSFCAPLRSRPSRSRYPDSELTFETTGDTVPALQAPARGRYRLPDLFEAWTTGAARTVAPGWRSAIGSRATCGTGRPAPISCARPWNAGRSMIASSGASLCSPRSIRSTTTQMSARGLGHPAACRATWEDLQEVAARSVCRWNGHPTVVRQALNGAGCPVVLVAAAERWVPPCTRLGKRALRAVKRRSGARLPQDPICHGTARWRDARPPPAGVIEVYVGPEPAPKNAAPPPLGVR